MLNVSRKKKRELAVVILSSVLIVFFTPAVAHMLINAWEIEGFVWSTAVSLTIGQGYDIDLVVIVPSGLILGWIILFASDESKRVQRPILVLFAMVFIGVLWSSGLWFGDTVDWVGHSPLFVASLFIGFSVGGLPEYILSRRRDFGRAGWLIYFFVFAAVIIGLSEVLVGNYFPDIQILGYTVSGGGLLVVLSVFLEYESDKDVLLIASGEEERTILVGGLCKTIKDEGLNYSFTGEGAEKAMRAINTIEDGDFNYLPDTRGIISFRYMNHRSLISRWVSVKAEGTDTRYIYRRMPSNPNPHDSGVFDIFSSVILKPVLLVLPPLLRNFLRGDNSGTVLERMDSSDTLVVAVSFTELDSEKEEDERTVNAIERILTRYSGTTHPEVVLVVTGGEKAKERHVEEEGGRPPVMNEGILEDYIRVNFFDDYYRAEIITVSVNAAMELEEQGVSWSEMKEILDRIGE